MKSLLNDDTAKYLSEIDYTSTWSVAHHMRFLMFAHYVVHNQITTVLDVGFGQDMLVKYLHNAGFTGKYVGIDMNEQYVEDAIDRQKSRDYLKFSVEYRLGDLRTATRAGELFDCIILGEVVEHVPLAEINDFMRTCREMLTWPYGSILLTTPNKQNDTITWPDDHDHEFSLAELTKLCEDAGLRIADTFGLWNNSENTFSSLRNHEKKVYTHLEMCIPNSMLNVFYNLMNPEKSRALLLVLTCKI